MLPVFFGKRLYGACCQQILITGIQALPKFPVGGRQSCRRKNGIAVFHQLLLPIILRGHGLKKHFHRLSRLTNYTVSLSQQAVYCRQQSHIVLAATGRQPTQDINFSQHFPQGPFYISPQQPHFGHSKTASRIQLAQYGFRLGKFTLFPQFMGGHI